jgi:glutamate-1-semialdehyde 2,1-aminomutase
MIARPLTEQIFTKSSLVIPGGVNSPIRAFLGLNMPPLITEKGSGDIITDVDGNTFIDYCMSWGALPLGHAHPKVVRAVKEQMAKGSSFGTATTLEKKIAEKITKHLPSIEKIRFVSSGTEATMSALRLARGYTGRPRFIKFNGNYHGHGDPFLVKAGSGVSFLPGSTSAGVPISSIQHTLSLPYNDSLAVKEAFASFNDIGAIIVEPIAANMGVIPASLEFLQTLREETAKHGALLIFDEVVTGFRSGLDGAQGKYGIKPDLTCLGKIIGGGLPAAAFGGKKEIMDFLAPMGSVYQAGTLSGNPLALAAGIATLEELEKPFVYEELEWKTRALLDPVRELIRQKQIPVAINQAGPSFTLFFGPDKVSCQEDLQRLDKEQYIKFYHHMFARGIYFSPSQQEGNFVSLVHSQESIEKTTKAMLEFFS